MSEFEKENGRIEGIDAPEGAWEKSAWFDADMVENAEASAAGTSSVQDAGFLQAHADAGHELIPINGKVPVGRGWTKAEPMNLAKAKARMAAGKNVGVRLRSIDLVIDVDPRNFDDGDDPFARLKKDFRLRDAPFVRTGGAGWHHHYRKPAELAVVDGLPNYKGVEFKSIGRQVVAAGSIHPETGNLYFIVDDDLDPKLCEAPDAAIPFLETIKRPAGQVLERIPGQLDPEDLARWLDEIDVADFKDERKWRDLMMACHHATGGAGIDEFTAWSTSDPEYSNYEGIIRRRWNSLAAKPEGIKIGTLISYLPQEKRREAVEVLNRSDPLDDFADDLEDYLVSASEPDFLRNKGRIEVNYRNTRLAVEFGNFDVGFDELEQRAVLRAEQLPWIADIGRELTDDLIRIVREWIMGQFGFEPRREDVADVLFTLATKNTFNPVVSYLDGLTWDGVQRIDKLFPNYFGSADGEYERAVGRKLMLAAVRRMRKPGTKFDTVPILEGRQGSGKTSALRILGGQWHSDAELGRVDGKDAAGVLHGVWIMELGELTAMNKAEVEHLKAFVSRCEDRYRPPYAKMVKTYYRRCVFVGTTNSGAYLRDQTGNRRYLPISTEDIDLDALRRDRDQLWAEAAAFEASGETLVLPSGLWSDAAEKQGDRMIDDPWLDRLRAYVECRPERTRFLSGDLMEQALEVHCSRSNQNDAKRVAILMSKLGWRHKANLRDGDRSGTGYVSPDDPTFKA